MTRSILRLHKTRRKNKTRRVRFKRKVTIHDIGNDNRVWSCTNGRATTKRRRR